MAEWWLKPHSKSPHAKGTDGKALCGIPWAPVTQLVVPEGQDPENACFNCRRVVHKQVGPRSHKSRYAKKPEPLKTPKSPRKHSLRVVNPEPVVPEQVFHWRQNPYSDLWHLIDTHGHPQCGRFEKRCLHGHTTTVTPPGHNCCIDCRGIFRDALKASA